MRRRILTPEEAFNRAAGLCAKCEQCSSDILKKLGGWGLTSSQGADIIRRLEQMKFLDDERFAHAYAHDKLVFSGWGKMKIVKGLWAKRLPRDQIQAAVDGLDPEEYVSVARRVMKSRVRLSPDLTETYEGRTKLLRFGVGRGFGISLMTRIIKEIKARRDEDEG